MGIREVARHLNVSIGTVSRALNDKSDVSPETKKRVLEAAARLGYSPNQSGRSLRQGTTGMIAVMIPTRRDTPLADTIFMTVLDGLRTLLADNGLDLVVLLCGPEEDPYAYLRRVVERRLADGVIISETQRYDPRIDYLLERQIPFVAFGRSLSGGTHPWIDLDFETVAEESVRRLAALGHERIALATCASELNYGYVFSGAYLEAMARHGLPIEPGLIFRETAGEAAGYRLGEELLALPQRPSAVILVDEAMAIGLYRRLGEAGLRPGEDMAVIGFLERPQCRFLSPALSCFRTPLHALGTRLGEALLATMPAHAEAHPHGIVQAVWPIEFVPGESLAARVPA